MAFQKYADFSTRSTRSEFWWFQLGYFLLLIPIVTVVIVTAVAVVGNFDRANAAEFSIVLLVGVSFILLFFIVTVIPQISIGVRRLHDAGLSGWLYLLIIIPYMGFVAWIIFGVLETQSIANKWGTIPGSEKKKSLRDSLVDFDKKT